MKKIVALMLCLALMISGAALAENAEKTTLGTLDVNGVFTIQCNMPEGYQVSILSADSTNIYAKIASDDPAKAQVTLSIAFNELFTLEDGTAQRLNDVDEEGLQEIRDSFLENLMEVDIQDGETAFGTKILIVKGKLDDGKSIVDVYSVFKSYEVEAVAYMGEGADDRLLTDAQVQMIIDLFSSMDFVEVGA